jgi:hypothetical protein
MDENFCLTHEQLAELQNKLAARLPAKRAPRAKALYNLKGSGMFARVPYPEILEVAARTGDALLAVLIAIIYQSWREDSPTVKLPSATLECAGINRFARGRALRRLVEAGVIKTDKPMGAAPRVTLIWRPS